MDATQLVAFFHPFFDDTVVGVDGDGEGVGGPVCPELRTFMRARLGDWTPPGSYHLVHGRSGVPAQQDVIDGRRRAVAELLRQIANDLLRKPEDRRID
jgi:hypothetical protein